MSKLDNLLKVSHFQIYKENKNQIGDISSRQTSQSHEEHPIIKVGSPLIDNGSIKFEGNRISEYSK